MFLDYANLDISLKQIDYKSKNNFSFQGSTNCMFDIQGVPRLIADVDFELQTNG